MLSDWALMRDADGLRLNYYGPSSIEVTLASGTPVTLTQTTEYPVSGRVVLGIDPVEPAEFTVKLRIPYWSTWTGVAVNGQRVDGVQPGQYLALARTWSLGDTVEIDFDMDLHYWCGERECAGLTSIYRGPLLLAYDHRYNLERSEGTPRVRHDDASQSLLPMPEIDARAMRSQRVAWDDWLPPLLLLEFEDVDGLPVRLCDFASAGGGGTPYRSWLRVRNAPGPVEFSRDSPLRTCR
jgi:DUF1680 family protein